MGQQLAMALSPILPILLHLLIFLQVRDISLCVTEAGNMSTFPVGDFSVYGANPERAPCGAWGLRFQ